VELVELNETQILGSPPEPSYLYIRVTFYLWSSIKKSPLERGGFYNFNGSGGGGMPRIHRGGWVLVYQHSPLPNP